MAATAALKADDDLRAVVTQLLLEHFGEDVVALVLDDLPEPGHADGLTTLASACANLSSGETGTLSLLFGEVAHRLGDVGLDELYDADQPAVALVDLLVARHAEWMAVRSTRSTRSA